MSDINNFDKEQESVIEDDDRYVMASPGIMVANDRSALREYYKTAKQNREKQQEVETLKRDVSNLSNEVSELKELILGLHAKLEERN